MNSVKFLWRLITSLKTTAILFVLFAGAIAVATFIENDYGVDTSWALIYKSKWFEALQVFLGINLVASLFHYKMFQKQKLPLFIFHMAFLFILVGAGVTRYFGYEGMMNIREGETESRMISSDAFVQISNGKNRAEKQIYLSALGDNRFSHTFKLDGESIEVTLKNFIRKAQRTLSVSPDGVKIYELVISTPYGPETYYLENGKVIELGYLNLYYNKTPDPSIPYISFYTKDGKDYFVSNYTFSYQNVTDLTKGEIVEGEEKEVSLKTLYSSGGFQLMTKRYEPTGKIKFYSKFNERASLEEQMKDTSTLSALFLDVRYNGKTEEVVLTGMGKGYQGFSEKVFFGDKNFSLEWGSKQIELPFALHLNKFIVEKYPGSKSPSSYESQVTLIDTLQNINEERRIYMNHTLIHGGYTFFQSSFDKDEKGTILSVNHDPGKWPTYIGYFLLTVGLLLNLLNKQSQFGKLIKTKYGRSTRMASLLVLLCASVFLPTSGHAYSGMEANYEGVHSLTQEKIAAYVKSIDKDHAALFGRILVQDSGGRIKPINTLAIEMINKVSGGPLLDLNHEQMFLGMVTRPTYWQNLYMFKVKHPEIKKLMGMTDNQNKFSYNDIFDQKGNYKISKEVDDAIRKKPAERGTYEKELIKLDEKLNVAYIIYNGLFFKSFPINGAKNNQWYTPAELLSVAPKEIRMNIEDTLRLNFDGVNEGYSKKNWTKANQAVQSIIEFQKNYASNILPAEILVKAEILYNNLLIFEKLFPVYLLSGLLLMLMIFARLLNPNINIKWSIKTVVFIMICGFILHTLNLGLRWYIAGHAPWSNSYEAMIYIAWTLVLSGIVFARESEFALATTGIFSGITLFVAHLSWLDPQITNLVPVLKSYWLTIHVSVITASYGFLGLGAMLGFITLLLMVFLGLLSNEKTKEQIVTNIKEGTRINQISMTVGLTLLIIGNFLGGVWANESWGRYWGWDPKESWTLITVVIYAAIIHLRYIPKMNNDYVLNSASLLAYSTVIMTYFGVNYYLSGLHSYASGDPIPIPTWLYVTTSLIGSLVIIAFFFRNKPKQYRTEKL